MYSWWGFCKIFSVPHQFLISSVTNCPLKKKWELKLFSSHTDIVNLILLGAFPSALSPYPLLFLVSFPCLFPGWAGLLPGSRPLFDLHTWSSSPVNHLPPACCFHLCQFVAQLSVPAHWDVCLCRPVCSDREFFNFGSLWNSTAKLQ